MPLIEGLLERDIVAVPEENDAVRFVLKFIVLAVPTLELWFCIATPLPDAVIPVSKEPSPENFVADIVPVVLILTATTPFAAVVSSSLNILKSFAEPKLSTFQR